MKFPIVLILSTTLLVGCNQSEPATESKPASAEKKQDASNRVTLTKENLEHVSIQTKEAQLGSLGITLKAAGRLGANLNKTAQME